MHRISAGLATCLAAAVTVGCGTVRAAPPGHPGGHTGTAAATPGGARLPAGCHRGTVGITQADNGRTFCVRVGDKVAVLLHSRDSRLWLRPLASGGALKPAPGGEASLVRGTTGAWFTAVRLGQVLVTSVWPPCGIAVPAAKPGLQPSDTVPRAYPLRFCAPGHRFSVTVVVAR